MMDYLDALTTRGKSRFGTKCVERRRVARRRHSRPKCESSNARSGCSQQVPQLPVAESCWHGFFFRWNGWVGLRRRRIRLRRHRSRPRPSLVVRSCEIREIGLVPSEPVFTPKSPFLALIRGFLMQGTERLVKNHR